tara:strand:- start:35 stop:193 length:159 start_codon:yes stop_codon:yes gene_type:complete
VKEVGHRHFAIDLPKTMGMMARVEYGNHEQKILDAAASGKRTCPEPKGEELP